MCLCVRLGAFFLAVALADADTVLAAASACLSLKGQPLWGGSMRPDP